MPTYFLQPESRQRAQPLLLTSLRLCLRATCAVKLLGLCGKTHFELRSPFKHVAANLRTMQLHSAVQLSAPRACRRRRGHKGQYQDSFLIKLIASTAIQTSTRGQFRHKSSRLSAPASTRVSAPAARCSGCGQRCRRTALHRALTCRRLSERSGAAAQRVGRHRRLNGVTQVCPERSET